MTKTDLVAELAKVSNLTKKESEAVLNIILDAITDALAKGDKVELRGFGSFRVRRRRARQGRNPKTGISVSVPEKKVPFFKAGKKLRKHINVPGPEVNAAQWTSHHRMSRREIDTLARG